MSGKKENFPARLEIAFGEGGERQTLVYEKVIWSVEQRAVGLQYGENPDQPAALYRLANGNLTIGEVSNITPGQVLASKSELLQSDSTLTKTNLTDADAALNILRYLADEPTCVVVKHNNPCGVAKSDSLERAFLKACMADRIGAVGGCVAFNRAVDKATAQAVLAGDVNVAVAPEYEKGVLELLAAKPALRVLRIGNINKLAQWAGKPYLDFTSLIDGGLVAQWSFVPATLRREDCHPASTMHRGKEYRVRRQPKPHEWDDLLFAWKIVSGLTSDSVIYVKEGVTVGIGCGEPDRLGAAESARDKAYRKLADRLAWDRFKVPFNHMDDPHMRDSIWEDAVELKGGLIGAVMASDGFLPNRDAVDSATAEGITAVIQPGGAPHDFESIQACNEKHATMVFTGQRSFRH